VLGTKRVFVAELEQCQSIDAPPSHPPPNQSSAGSAAAGDVADRTSLTSREEHIAVAIGVGFDQMPYSTAFPTFVPAV
jgi:hypothetical protein